MFPLWSGGNNGDRVSVHDRVSKYPPTILKAIENSLFSTCGVFFVIIVISAHPVFIVTSRL